MVALVKRELKEKALEEEEERKGRGREERARLHEPAPSARGGALLLPLRAKPLGPCTPHGERLHGGTAAAPVRSGGVGCRCEKV